MLSSVMHYKKQGWMASCNNKNPVSVNIDFNHQIFGDRLKVKKKIIEIE